MTVSDIVSRSTLSLAGDLSIQTAADHQASILAALDIQTSLDIDLRDVTEIDTAGLQILLLARRQARAQGVQLRFTEPAACVREVLATVGLDETLGALGHIDQASRASVGQQQ